MEWVKRCWGDPLPKPTVKGAVSFLVRMPSRICSFLVGVEYMLSRGVVGTHELLIFFIFSWSSKMTCQQAKRSSWVSKESFGR